MASGKLTTTRPRARSQPLNTAGTDVTIMVGSKNKWRNLFEFHAFTQSCSLSILDNCSAGVELTMSMTWSDDGMARVCPSAVT